MLIALICAPPGERAWWFIFSITLMAVGVYLFYGATRGRVLPLLAAIGKERIVWTRIVATVLFLLGAMVFVSALFRLGCGHGSPYSLLRIS